MATLSMFDSGDTFLIILFIIMFSGGAFAATRSRWSAAQTERLQRIEDKVNLIMTHLGLDYVPANMERWQRIAPKDKEEAVTDYQNDHGVSQEEAQAVVEQYLADQQQRPW